MTQIPSAAFILLCFLRAAGLCALLPLGHGFQPIRKTALALGLTLLAAACSTAGAAQMSVVLTPGMLVTELAVGAGLSIAAGLTIEAAGMLGELIDSGRGQAMASFYDPLSAAPSTGMMMLMRSYGLALLLLGGGAEALLRAFLESTELIPPGSGCRILFSEQGCLQLLTVLWGFLSAVVWLYLPFAVLFFLIDGACGVAAKLLPRLALTQEAFQIKSLAALGALLVLNEFEAALVVPGLGTPMLHLLRG